LNYENALDTYDQLSKNKIFVTFLRELESKTECKGITMMGYFVKPMQRICQYPVLLKELLRYTPKAYNDFPNIEFCWKTLQGIADYTNDRKKILENVQRMMDVRDKLTETKTFVLMAPGRMYIREALLGKVNNHGKLQDRHFMLFNDCLVYAVAQKKSLQYKGHIMLNQCLVSDLSSAKYKNAIAITRLDGSKKRYLMIFSNAEHKQLWSSDITKIVDNVNKKNKDKRTQ